MVRLLDGTMKMRARNRHSCSCRTPRWYLKLSTLRQPLIGRLSSWMVVSMIEVRHCSDVTLAVDEKASHSEQQQNLGYLLAHMVSKLTLGQIGADHSSLWRGRGNLSRRMKTSNIKRKWDCLLTWLAVSLILISLQNFIPVSFTHSAHRVHCVDLLGNF